MSFDENRRQPLVDSEVQRMATLLELALRAIHGLCGKRPITRVQPIAGELRHPCMIWGPRLANGYGYCIERSKAAMFNGPRVACLESFNTTRYQVDLHHMGSQNTMIHGFFRRGRDPCSDERSCGPAVPLLGEHH